MDNTVTVLSWQMIMGKNFRYSCDGGGGDGSRSRVLIQSPQIQGRGFKGN